MEEGRKVFFFEKKKQKTFACRLAAASPTQAKVQKFFGSFFQKRTLTSFLLLLPVTASAQIRSVSLQPPKRDFGYFVGDLFVSTAAITVAPGTTLDTRSLPAAGPVTSSTDLRRIDVSEASAQTITIRTEYQTFSAPEEVSQVTVPGYQLTFMQAGTRLTATVPAFSFASSPFRHDLTPIVDLTVVRPDRSMGPANMSRSRLESLAGGIVAFLAILAILAAEGRAPWRQSRAPFALAARQIGKCREPGRRTLLVLHRALDTTAGERVLADDLDGFLRKHRHFAGLRTELQDFFAVSRESFFGDRDAVPHSFADKLTRLARSLARAERGR